jgi:hypothetical protein
LRAYWKQRIEDNPASELDDLQPVQDGISVSYVSRRHAVRATLEFNATGEIVLLRCGPLIEL